MNFKKAKNEIPNMEDIDCDTQYAFTLNPSDKHQHFGKTNRLSKCITELEVILFHNSASYCLFPEISKKGRVHYHGYIKIHNPYNFFLNAIHYILNHGTIVIKKIEDEGKWEDYILKQHGIMLEECQINLITYPYEKGLKLNHLIT
jgi:hypothetical protein